MCNENSQSHVEHFCMRKEFAYFCIWKEALSNKGLKTISDSATLNHMQTEWMYTTNMQIMSLWVLEVTFIIRLTCTLDWHNVNKLFQCIDPAAAVICFQTWVFYTLFEWWLNKKFSIISILSNQDSDCRKASCFWDFLCCKQ